MPPRLHLLLLATVAFVFAMPGAHAVAAPKLQPVENRIPPLPKDVFEIGKVTRAPVATHQVPPVHPPVLMVAGIGGEVQVVFTVKADGTIADVMIGKATDARFAAAVLEVVPQWRYRPAQLRNRAVACRLVIPLTFSKPVETTPAGTARPSAN